MVSLRGKERSYSWKEVYKKGLWGAGNALFLDFYGSSADICFKITY